jgi:hypothetical protein
MKERHQAVEASKRMERACDRAAEVGLEAFWGGGGWTLETSDGRCYGGGTAAQLESFLDGYSAGLAASRPPGDLNAD